MEAEQKEELNMTYETFFAEVKETLLKADASGITDHLAYQFNITGNHLLTETVRLLPLPPPLPRYVPPAGVKRTDRMDRRKTAKGRKDEDGFEICGSDEGF